MHSLLGFMTGVTLLACTYAQFPPTPEGVTTIKSKFNSDITISYKEVCFFQARDLRFTNNIAARNMRDYTGSEIILRLRSFTTWNPYRCG